MKDKKDKKEGNGSGEGGKGVVIPIVSNVPTRISM